MKLFNRIFSRDEKPDYNIPEELRNAAAFYITAEQREAYCKQGIWIDRDGFLNPLNKMSDNRLTNLVRFLIRQAEKRALEVSHFYLTCPEPQGEMAQVAFDAEFSFWVDGDDSYAVQPWAILLAEHPIYKSLMNELFQRPALREYYNLINLSSEESEEENE